MSRQKLKAKPQKQKDLWRPLGKAVLTHDDLPQDVKDAIGANEIWMNDMYTVFVRRHERSLTESGQPMLTWLSIKRNDKEPIHDWRHFQYIKNQLCGEECEGVEIYPAESRLVDGSNQYHLWVLEDSENRLPFGFNEGRQISEHPFTNGKQRPFPVNMKPHDLEEQERLIYEKMEQHNKNHGTNFKM